MVREWWKLATNWPPKKGVQIRLVRRGCVNREFFQIGVMPVRRRPGLPPKEVIGSYDPMPNEKGEKLVALDLDRFFFWMGQGALLSRGVFTTLGEKRMSVMFKVYLSMFSFIQDYLVSYPSIHTFIVRPGLKEWRNKRIKSRGRLQRNTNL